MVMVRVNTKGNGCEEIFKDDEKKRSKILRMIFDTEGKLI